MEAPGSPEGIGHGVSSLVGRVSAQKPCRLVDETAGSGDDISLRRLVDRLKEASKVANRKRTFATCSGIDYRCPDMRAFEAEHQVDVREGGMSN
jgi:hypothetical protein